MKKDIIQFEVFIGIIALASIGLKLWLPEIWLPRVWTIIIVWVILGVGYPLLSNIRYSNNP